MRILIIEDDVAIRDMLARSFREVCFAVDTTGLGNEGINLALSNDYDLIVLDCTLPDSTAVDICRCIRRANKHSPILILSIYLETERKVTLLDQGADDYMTKPFSFQELLARVRALLRRNPSIVSQILQVHDIVIDCGRQTVSIGKHILRLTRKEFALLEYLARNCGLVMSRGLLMEHVWDKDINLFSNTIEAHIFSLRRKLGSRAHYIVTVPGRGYKLIS